VVPRLEEPGRFDNVKRDVDTWKDEFMVCAGVSMLFRKCWILTGFARFMEALYLEREEVEQLADIITEYLTRETEEYIKAGVDIIQLGGDLGSEESMLINPTVWREIFKPRLKKIITATKREGVYFYLHSDGNIEEIVPDIIDVGIDILNPIQPECMDPEKIKREFGENLTLHGTMSVQKLFPYATPADIRSETQRRIETCGYDGGLILGPTNAFSTDIPLENILSFYNEVRTQR
jgi:uroporphyrinogen decarboxylase